MTAASASQGRPKRRRGTFVQRHASIVDSVTGDDYLPVKAMERNGGKVRIKTAPGEGTEVQLEMPRTQ